MTVGLYVHKNFVNSCLSIFPSLLYIYEYHVCTMFYPVRLQPLEKRYSKIDQHLARYFKYNSGCLSSPPPFLCSQIITTFSNSIISTNQVVILATCGIRIPLF